MLPHTVYCRDKKGPQHTHQETCAALDIRGPRVGSSSGKGLEVTREQRPTPPRAPHRRADLRASGAHAHPGSSRAVAQSRALVTQEAVGDLLPLDRRSSRRCRSLVLPEVLEPARAAGLAAARTPLWRRAHAAAAEAILLLTVSTPYASSEALPTSPDVARTPPGMAGPVVAWSLDDAATACKHEPRIVREHARKADGMARPVPWPWAQRRVQPPIQVQKRTRWAKRKSFMLAAW